MLLCHVTDVSEFATSGSVWIIYLEDVVRSNIVHAVCRSIQNLAVAPTRRCATAHKTVPLNTERLIRHSAVNLLVQNLLEERDVLQQLFDLTSNTSCSKTQPLKRDAVKQVRGKGRPRWAQRLLYIFWKTSIRSEKTKRDGCQFLDCSLLQEIRIDVLLNEHLGGKANCLGPKTNFSY